MKKKAQKKKSKSLSKSATKKAAQKSEKPAKKAASKKTVKAEATAYKIGPGQMAPQFSVPSTSGETRTMKSIQGSYAVLYFYPKDNTPGCTLEGQDFRRLHNEFKKAGCTILGVSRDSLKSHDGFRAKCDFPFELLADTDGKLCTAFDVIQMKSLYGRKFEGIERSTFLIGKDGRILREWRKVKVNGHAQEVLEALKAQG